MIIQQVDVLSHTMYVSHPPMRKILLTLRSTEYLIISLPHNHKDQSGSFIHVKGNPHMRGPLLSSINHRILSKSIRSECLFVISAMLLFLGGVPLRPHRTRGCHRFASYHTYLSGAKDYKILVSANTLLKG